ncbi:MAG TPA: hypothetical protein VGA75_11865 [Paracoccaceae bacterium]
MPAATWLTLLLIVLAAAALTVYAVTSAGLPLGIFGLLALIAAGALHLWRAR